MIQADLDHARVGHDNGALVLQFDRSLPLPPDRVRGALRATTTAACSVCRAEWEVDGTGDGSRMTLTVWVDGEDIDAAAAAGAGWHLAFERTAHAITEDVARTPLEPRDRSSLAAHYAAAMAAALADAD